MSGEGPESIPTSADPRSKRPTKKRALTPVSAQSSSIDALFAKPDQYIPTSSSTSVQRRDPSSAIPEIVANVQGSSAGAGSGEFHVYKAARRREYERLRLMDEDLKKEQEEEEFEKSKEEREKKDDEKTRRNREKREKMKARKAKAKAGGGGEKKAGGGSGGYSKGGPRIDVLKGLNKENGASRHGDSGSTDTMETNGAEASEEPKGIVIEDD